jgi:hypothetical protein
MPLRVVVRLVVIESLRSPARDAVRSRLAMRGIAVGLSPAVRAARVDPIVALRAG